MTEELHIKGFSEYPDTLKFLLSFIQALLKTGYYTPGHPETSKARKGLYDNFISTVKGHRELTFVSTAIKGTRNILIDGIDDEPIPISNFMLKGMAEMFVPKFLAYFDRKNLSSFSIKEAMTMDEFEAFIDIMSETPLHEEKKTDSREHLTLELIKRSILHVSTVFNIDLVGKERKLPWRVEMALTRLKKDLSLIPLYKHLTEEKMAELKHTVFDDIIRPIKSHAIIKDILLNLDIISQDIAGINKEEFESRITDYIHKDYLLLASPEILKFYAFLKESYEKIPDENILNRITFIRTISKKVGFKIMGYGLIDETVLLDYFNLGILTLEELPENLRIKIKRKEGTEDFLKNTRKYFSALEKAEGEEEIRSRALGLLNFLPELIIRNQYSTAEEVLRKLNKTKFQFTGIDSMLLDEIISIAEKKLEESTKEEQVKILELIDLMDNVSIAVFINFLTHNSRLVRKISCEALIRHGKAVIPALKHTLENRKDWYYIRNALMVLGEVGQGSADLEDSFKKYLNHKEPRVRVEAVAGIVNITGISAEGLLINMLKDEDPNVRRKVVWALGKINSVKPEVTDYFIHTITGKQKEEDSVIEQILSSVQTYPPEADATRQLEQTISEVLSKGHGILGKFTAHYIQSDHIRARMCETLGCIGSRKSIDLLEKIAKKDSPLIKAKAREAIERISQKNR